MRHALKRHPDSPSAATAIEAEITRTGTRVDLHYTVTGDIPRILIPELSTPSRADELWRHTCLEIFIRVGDAPGYVEFNFSPTGQWAAYSFTGRRQGMSRIPEAADPGIGTRSMDNRFDLRAWLDLSQIPGLTGPWLVGLSAIIELTDGSKSFWALQHPVGQPDFHHADCFALRLPPAESP
jgi:hypothetical protein